MLLEIDVSQIQNMAECALADLADERNRLLDWTIKRTDESRSHYERAKERSDGSWESMSWACGAISIDVEKLIATVKAMNRQTKRLNWNKCFYLKDHQIGGLLLAENDIFMKSWYDRQSAYRVTRVLP